MTTLAPDHLRQIDSRANEPGRRVTEARGQTPRTPPPAARNGLRQLSEWADAYLTAHPEANRWVRGYGGIQHTVETEERVFRMAQQLAAREITGDGVPLFELLAAVDRLASASAWLLSNLSPVRRGHANGASRSEPRVGAYLGYLAINALTGTTRGLLSEDADLHRVLDRVAPLVRGCGWRPPVTGVVSASGSSQPLPEICAAQSGASRVALIWDVSQADPKWFRSWRQTAATCRIVPILFAPTSPEEVFSLVAGLGATGLEPIPFDGRDPAAFAWAIFEIDCRLLAVREALGAGADPNRLGLPIGLALTRQPTPPGAAWGRVCPPPEELVRESAKLQRHAVSGRPREGARPGRPETPGVAYQVVGRGGMVVDSKGCPISGG